MTDDADASSRRRRDLLIRYAAEHRLVLRNEVARLTALERLAEPEQRDRIASRLRRLQAELRDVELALAGLQIPPECPV